MISGVRTIFRNFILTVDPTFKEWVDAFNTDNVPSSIFNKTYHIFYSIPNSVRGQTTTTDEINITVKLFFSGHRIPQSALDAAMDTAHLIRLQCTSRSLTPVGYLGIECTSIVPEALSTNDNKFIVTLTFTAAKYFTNC
jgi:hypothetical protein